MADDTTRTILLGGSYRESLHPGTKLFKRVVKASAVDWAGNGRGGPNISSLVRELTQRFLRSGARFFVSSYGQYIPAQETELARCIREELYKCCRPDVRARELGVYGQWKAALKLDATLLDEIEYAKCLYDESMSCTDNTSPQSIVQALSNTPIGPRFVCHSKGVSVDWILDVFCQSPFLIRLKEVDCELSFFRRVCVVEILRRLGLHSGSLVDHVELVHESLDNEVACPIVQDATVFVSYTGRYSFSIFIELLGRLRGEYVWMDAFCVDQFAWTGHNTLNEVQYLRETLIEGLESQIRSIGKVVVLLQSWDQTMYTLNRIWVLWEVFIAVQAGAELSILLTDREQANCMECFHGQDDHFYQIQDNLLDIDCEKAKSDDDVARQRIFHRMDGAGLADIKRRVTQWVQSWFREQRQKSTHFPDRGVPRNTMTGVTSNSFLSSIRGIDLSKEGMYQKLLGDINGSSLQELVEILDRTDFKKCLERIAGAQRQHVLSVSAETPDEIREAREDWSVSWSTAVSEGHASAMAFELLRRVLKGCLTRLCDWVFTRNEDDTAQLVNSQGLGTFGHLQVVQLLNLIVPMDRYYCLINMNSRSGGQVANTSPLHPTIKFQYSWLVATLEETPSSKRMLAFVHAWLTPAWVDGNP